MTTKANIARWKVYLGDSASPPNYSNLEEVKTVSGLGKTNKLVDVTNMDSPANSMEYIAGRADGQEVTITCNRVPETSPPTQQQVLMDHVDAGETVPIRARYTGGSSPEDFEFDGVCLSWKITPSLTEANQIEFTIKISGEIVR